MGRKHLLMGMAQGTHLHLCTETETIIHLITKAQYHPPCMHGDSLIVYHAIVHMAPR